MIPSNYSVGLVKKPLTLSIIVPVYNTERYLHRCIDSILNQSFVDFELLLIDDGSKDGSGSICDYYASKDSRVIVYHIKNGGVSFARNIGLDNARGEWLYFVDSDDELLPGGLQVLVDGISEDVDLVGGGYRQYGTKGDVLQAIDDQIVLTFTKDDSLLLLFSSHPFYYSYMGYVWIWLFRSRIVREKRIRFNSGIKIKEDTLFVVQYMCQSNGRSRFNTIPVYKYNSRDDSAMGRQKIAYDPSFQTSFDAVIKIHSCICQLPNVKRELLEAARFEVVDRIYMVYGRMKKFDAIDNSVITRMTRRAIKEVGLPCFLSYQYHRNLRRIKRLIKRTFKID